MRGRAKEAEEKKRLEKERKEVPEEVKDKFEKWNRYEKLYESHNAIYVHWSYYHLGIIKWIYISL